MSSDKFTQTDTFSIAECALAIVADRQTLDATNIVWWMRKIDDTIVGFGRTAHKQIDEWTAGTVAGDVIARIDAEIAARAAAQR